MVVIIIGESRYRGQEIRLQQFLVYFDSNCFLEGFCLRRCLDLAGPLPEPPMIWTELLGESDDPRHEEFFDEMIPEDAFNITFTFRHRSEAIEVFEDGLCEESALASDCNSVVDDVSDLKAFSNKSIYNLEYSYL